MVIGIKKAVVLFILLVLCAGLRSPQCTKQWRKFALGDFVFGSQDIVEILKAVAPLITILIYASVSDKRISDAQDFAESFVDPYRSQ